MYFEALAEHYHFSLDEPVNKLSKEALDAVLYGNERQKDQNASPQRIW